MGRPLQRLASLRDDVARWRDIWVLARQIQEDTGIEGDMDDWQAAWTFAEQCARGTSRRLVDAAISQLEMVHTILGRVQGLAGLIERMDGWLPPNVKSMLLDGLGSLDSPAGQSPELDVCPVGVEEHAPSFGPQPPVRLNGSLHTVDLPPFNR